MVGEKVAIAEDINLIPIITNHYNFRVMYALQYFSHPNFIKDYARIQDARMFDFSLGMLEDYKFIERVGAECYKLTKSGWAATKYLRSHGFRICKFHS